MSQPNGSTPTNGGSEYLPSNFRIYSIRTAKRMLHVEDCLHIGRIRFELWAYEKGNGSTGHVDAYVTTDDARLIGAELMRAEFEAPIERMGGGLVKGNVIARTFKIEQATGTDLPIRLTIGNAPGSRQENGLISINKNATVTRLQILLSTVEARKLGWALRDHLTAWACATYTARVNAAIYHPSQPGEALPDPIFDEQQDPEEDPRHQQDLDDEAATASKTPPAPKPTNKLTDPPVLTYQDGSAVQDNPLERKAFVAYVEAVKAKPDSLPSLRSWAKRTGWTDTAG